MDTLKAAEPYLPPDRHVDEKSPLFDEIPAQAPRIPGLSPSSWRRLCGRYGPGARTLLSTARPEELEAIPGTRTLWAELPYAARTERIRHLDDLLLRRVRIGLLTPRGASEYLGHVRRLCLDALPWNRRRWKKEIAMYLEKWNYAHGFPAGHVQSPSKRAKLFFIRAWNTVRRVLP